MPSGCGAVALPFGAACGKPQPNRVFKNKHQAVSQGVRRFGKRSLFSDRWAFTKAAQRRLTASGAVFQHPVTGCL